MNASRNHFISLLAVVALMASGCWSVELELPVSTGVAVIQGNEILHKAGVRIFGELFEPVRVDQDLAEIGDMSSFYLESFYLGLNEDSIKPGDDDDLGFIDRMIVYIRPASPYCGLAEVEIARFERGLDRSTDEELVFSVTQRLELLPYLECGFELRSDVEGMVPPDDVSVEGIAIFVMVPGS
ncbi:MAG: hypothetical protein ABIK09_06710 [Pseudomonadota bacterium]